MTLKTSYKNLYRLEAKRNLFLTCFSGFAIFLALPFYFMQQIVTFGSDYGVAFRYASKDLLVQRVVSLRNLTYGNLFFLAVLIGLAFLNGIVRYSYLSDKSKQDFYFAMPVKKSDFFWLGYKQGIGNIVLPLCINLALMFLLAGANGCLTIGFTVVLLYVSLVGYLTYCACFAVTLLACVLTGRMVFHMLGTLTLLAYAPVVYIILEYLVDGRMYYLNTIMKYIYLLSPVSAGIWFFGQAGNASMGAVPEDIALVYKGGKSVVALLVIALVTLAAARVLYGKRNASDTGKTIVFKHAKKVIKGFLAVLFTLIGAVIVSSMYDMNSMTYKITGAVFGFLLGSYLVDILLELNWKGNIRNWKEQMVYLGISAAAFVSVIGFQNHYRYNGFDKIGEEYTKEQAQNDKCVVMNEDKCYEASETFEDCIRDIRVYKEVAGVESLDRFIEDIALGKESKVRLADYWAADYSTLSDYLYEDGEIKRYDNYNLYGVACNYKYMVRLTGKFDPKDTKRVYYVLTSKKDYSFEDFRKYVIDWNVDYNEADCVLAYDIEEGKGEDE
ncbi:hypothetical protein [[Clostridium] polysaccharolyticum]|uniref:Uncharacterized protein n=1 Tax=[Clostridium] polysaccharolyticum TaxID=29364 RepID=A0A1I0B8I8_9FIRM|nr:hypothetical protein [[Clostridium] polysaccharolyticum]SET02733.1 hypothetical protein SAMN04487772_1077 [[Clostridium] polysaccharolyticum]